MRRETGFPFFPYQAVGFQEVGVYEKHGQLEGVWHDVVIVEQVIARNLATTS